MNPASLVEPIADPERFGIAVFDDNHNLVDILRNSHSSFAIGGIYLFDETFWSR